MLKIIIVKCCLNKFEYTHNQGMNTKKLLNKINIKKQYNFNYLYKPLIYLSVISAAVYVLKLFGFLYADKLFFFAELTVLSVSYINNSKNNKNKCIFMFSVFIAMVFYIVFIDNLVFYLAKKCENSGVKFGVINQLFNTFALDDLEILIYRTSFGGSKFINGSIVTGAIDIFNVKKGTLESALFLCGKYFTIFSALGISLAIGKRKKEILFIALTAMLTGNFSVFLIILLIDFTPYYFIYLLFAFLSYFFASYANLRSGFYCSGSIFELFFQKDNLVNIFAIGALITAVSYYASRLVNEKLKW